MYADSINNPDKFWATQAKEFLDWTKDWKKTSNVDYTKGQIEWFKGGELNVAYNCIDRHLPKRAKQTAIIWEGDNPEVSESVTYQQLHDRVAKFANGLKKLGVKKGDRVCIYMPMILEASYAMLACARIGAIHSVVFGGFSPEALKDRILDSECKIVITADEGVRGGKAISLKSNVDKAVSACDCVNSVIVVQHTKGEVHWGAKDVWYHDLVSDVPAECPCESFDAETPLFILYTSGSTGKPKGVLHTSGGYLLYAAMTHKYAFDYQEGDVYWCTADVGWVTGHSYIVYGPLANGATTLMFEGIPTYPDASRFWQVIDKHQVNTFYTAPTAIRSLMGAGDEFVEKTDRSSLRILGTVGEPINPEAWEWYYHTIGQSRCPVVDTWWQTETGGHMILPLPYATPLKPGSASMPFFGIEPQVVNEQGEVLEGEAEGILVLARSWPGQMRTLYNNHERFIEAYFSTFPGKYFAGDGVKRDSDGYYWITGRVDDVLNISGHRLGTAEIESALVVHESVSEAAVVGYPHDIKGQGIYAYVSIMSGVEPTDALKTELVKLVRSEIGPIATVDKIQFAPGLPKTRSGKIMRRILRKIAQDDYDNLGDTSTLAEPEVVEDLIKNRIE
jgi:acetyl-CoA synthetase